MLYFGLPHAAQTIKYYQILTKYEQQLKYYHLVFPITMEQIQRAVYLIQKRI